MLARINAFEDAWWIMREHVDCAESCITRRDVIAKLNALLEPVKPDGAAM